ncbi:Lar family restriction alleviation protein [Alcanivorax sp.]|uniref:Lar family restriction alleviation protein n=1 Tax=Alcanivorax sp. TaxID=1872427 RepID=UPI003BAB2CDB
MDKLKPCPFCGGDPEYERHGTNRQSCIIACGDCGARIESGETEGLEGGMWNTRTADDELTAVNARIAELKKALEPLSDTVNAFADFQHDESETLVMIKAGDARRAAALLEKK